MILKYNVFIPKIQRTAFTYRDWILASEVPVWKKLNNIESYVGYIDLNFVNNDTFFFYC